MTFNIKLDTREADGLLTGVLAGLRDRRRLHELYVIQTQGWIFRNWPKGPPLTGLTVATRRKGSSAVLLDKGMLRLSFIGPSPATKISTAEGTLNAARNEEGVVGTRLPYAAIHQYGGTIRARNVKNLAIPMTKKARAMGSPRAWGEGQLQFVPSKKSGVTGLLVERSKVRPFVLHYVMTPEMTRKGKTIRSRGKPFMIPVSKAAERAGPPSDMAADLTFIRASKDKAPTIGYLVEMKQRRRTTAHYLLRKSVSIPARPMLPSAAQITPDLVKVTEFYLTGLVSGKKGGSGG
jgi:hypothetical protein